MLEYSQLTQANNPLASTVIDDKKCSQSFSMIHRHHLFDAPFYIILYTGDKLFTLCSTMHPTIKFSQLSCLTNKIEATAQ